MTFRSISIGLAAFMLSGFLLLWTAPLWFVSGMKVLKYQGVPSDQELVTAFRGHHSMFETLRKMAVEDGASLNNSMLSKPRKEEYDRLLSNIEPGLEVVIDETRHQNISNEVVKFIFASSGSAIGSSWFKGIEFVPGEARAEGDIRQNLDTLQNVPDGDYLRPIEPHWFVVYDQQLE